jgi:hypothetical protein
MCVFAYLAMTLQTLLTTEAEHAAQESGCVRRRRKLSGAPFVQTLVLGWMHDPHASLDSLADFATDLGADLTPKRSINASPPPPPAVWPCYGPPPQRVIAATPTAIPLLQRFQGVYFFDTTTVRLPAVLADLFPGCGGGDGETLLFDFQECVSRRLGTALTAFCTPSGP